MTTADRVHDIFVDRQYTWKIDGKDQVPDREYIEDTLNVMKLRLMEDEEASQIEMGRLLLLKTDGHYDVYVLAGEC